MNASRLLYTGKDSLYNKKMKSMQREGGYMTRLELLTLLLSIKALLESNNADKALELINEVIAEAKRKE